MREKMNAKEEKVATRLINYGLQKAASSLEQVLNSPISIKAIDFAIVDVKDVPKFHSKSGPDTYVLTTKLVGSLNGICHMILSKSEVGKVHAACLPENIIQSDSDEHKMLKRELLTEIDNIVAAAAITQFSDFLKLSMFGGVPGLQITHADKVDDYIRSESNDLDALIHFKAYIHGPELDIIPDFVWLIEEKFMEKVRELASSPAAAELNENMND